MEIGLVRKIGILVALVAAIAGFGASNAHAYLHVAYACDNYSQNKAVWRYASSTGVWPQWTYTGSSQRVNDHQVNCTVNTGYPGVGSELTYHSVGGDDYNVTWYILYECDWYKPNGSVVFC